ncbi:MFI2 family protein [Megaselia abdita]
MKLIFGLLFLAGSSFAAGEPEFYRMCVPNEFHQDCLDLLKDPSEAGINMKCVPARDRMECLELIENRKADVLAVDPEDMYVAYHMKNEDFKVISEFRTEVEKDAPFRYEGVILVKKGSDIKSLKDLQGKKSCHTGFGRNVGYKIPITKLKKNNVLKVSADQTITATERELKSLSQFFSKSCLVGTYSPHPEVDRLLKKKYSNLCALCEQPEQCNYPDKYSGYDGAIRCLDKGEGDVAFTKTFFVKKYFMPHPESSKAAEGNPENYEYLCEDGSRLPITGPACSWAQRPWKGYISNSDNVQGDTLLKSLQQRLDKFFENGLKAQNKEAAKHLLIDSGLVMHDKPEAVDPKQYLEKAGYKDVIERDGSMTGKITMCVKNNEEMDKCNAMKRAAFSRDIRPEFECIQDPDCISAVQTKKATMAIVDAADYAKARKAELEPLVYERRDNYMVVVVDPSLNKDKMEKLPVKFDKNNQRSLYAALLLKQLRGGSSCEELPEVQESQIQIVNSNDLNNYKDKQLICPTNLKETIAITEFRTCNFEANLPRAVFVHTDRSKIEKDTYKHAMVSLSDSFGPQGKLPDVFELFGAFSEGHNDVLFNDDAVEFTTDLKSAKLNGNEELYNKLTCKNSI